MTFAQNHTTREQLKVILQEEFFHIQTETQKTENNHIKMADSANKRNIPIRMGDFSVIDSEFANVRERFENEMRKMEDEMAKFRSDLMNRESNYFESTR